MEDLKAFLKTLITAPGLSGHEAPVRSLIDAAWRPLVDEISFSRLGSLHALRRGISPEPRPSILISTHMDAIGLMVKSIDQGFLRLMQIGGLDVRVLPGQLVTVHGRRELPGIIVQPPAHLLPPDQQTGPVSLAYLLVDTGLDAEAVNRLVRPGDLVAFAQAPFELDGDLLVGHTLDNRAAVAALTACLQELQGRQTTWDLWAVASVQEEETLAGAITSSFALRPTVAIAVDVTFGAAPGSPSHRTFPLGQCITLGWGPVVHPALYKAVKTLAERIEIPYRLEPFPRTSSSDADGLLTAAEGIPTMAIFIPLRYMHTPVEMVSMKDIRRTGRLLAEFIAGLELDFIDQLTWDN